MVISVTCTKAVSLGRDGLPSETYNPRRGRSAAAAPRTFPSPRFDVPLARAHGTIRR